MRAVPIVVPALKMRNNIPDNLKMLDSAETECEFHFL